MMIFKNCVKSNPIITRTAQKKVARIDIGIKAPKLVAILAFWHTDCQVLIMGELHEFRCNYAHDNNRKHPFD